MPLLRLTSRFLSHASWVVGIVIGGTFGFLHVKLKEFGEGKGASHV